jgi:hypothetical protein
VPRFLFDLLQDSGAKDELRDGAGGFFNTIVKIEKPCKLFGCQKADILGVDAKKER